MNDFNTKRKSLESNTTENLKNSLLEDEKNKIKKKVNYSLQINSITSHGEKVQKIISGVEAEDRSLIDLVMNEEMTRQNHKFKSRLEEKRKKQSALNLTEEDSGKKKRYSMFLKKISGIKLSDLSNSLEKIKLNKLPSCLEEICEKDEPKLIYKISSPLRKTSSIHSKKSQSDQTVNSDDSDSENGSSEIKLFDSNNKNTSLEKVENSFDPEQIKIKESEDLLSPIPKIENLESNIGTCEDIFKSSEKYNKEISTSLFKINENVINFIII